MGKDMKPLTYASAMKLAKQCDAKIDDITSNYMPSDRNLQIVNDLMARAENLRAIANNIASTYLKNRKTSN